MIQYSHDYTLVQEAMDLLYSATRLHANECYREALDRINEARTTLNLYLSKDNMVPDDDTADGWVRANDMEVRITPSDVKEAARVVRHGKIDRQYKQQLDGVGDPSCPLYDKVVRITGTFDQIQMSRDEVAAACQRMGAKSASEGICKSMDIVIIGNNPGPTKQAKIEAWRSEGCNITTLSQFDFKEILNKYDTTQ